jgi:signal transduction histidine kinase
VAVADCFDDALALLGPRLEAASVRVEGSPRTRSDVYAFADRRLLVHALVNLLKNAIEATATTVADPCITLLARADGERAWIEVSDNGPGIPASEQARIFDVGYSTKGAGRGRGLAIVRESIQVQGGDIAIENRPGAGACFRIGLPAANHRTNQSA